jgi:proteasome accessory factor C
MNVAGRINRILFILSYVSQYPGITVESLAEKVGMRPRALIKELEFISLIGKPPFKPDDYVDIYVEEDRVYIEFDQSLNRPLRFTRPEAVALLMSLELLDPEVDPEGVRSLKSKIAEAVAGSVDASGGLQDRVALERPSLLISDHFGRIRQAIENRRKLRIEYFSLTRNKKTRRVIRPYHLMKRIGFWYLTGYCESRKDLRTFKFERILSLRMLDETFDPPEDFDVVKYRSDFLRTRGEQKVEIHFDSKVAPWIKEQWGAAAADRDDGGVVLTLYSETLEFPSRLVLGSAPHASPIGPEAFIEKVRNDARRIMELQSEEMR